MRVFWSAVGGVCVCVASFIIFNVLYVEWAIRRYPHNNSMAGLAAVIYGAPVGLGCGIAAACLIGVALRNRSLPGDVPDDVNTVAKKSSAQ